MGSFDVLTLDEQTELQVAAFANELPDKNIARNSDNWKRQRVTAAATTDLHAHVDAAQRDALPDLAGEATIEEHGDTVGVPRRAATPASGENAGKIRGLALSAWTTANTLLHKSGLRFRPTANGAIGGAATEALTGIIAIDTGPRTRLTAGEVLLWEVAAPAGLENEVELVADLSSGGEDKEPIGEYRARILNRTSQPAMGGNANDWKQWMLDSSAAIKGAYVYPNRNGLGSMDIAALKAGTGAARLLDGAERTALQTYVNALRPVHCGVPRVLEVLLQTQAVEVKVDPELGTAFSQDWDDSTPPVVSTWTAGTRTLVFTGARPPSMGVGHRLTVAGTPGLELKIEALSSTNAVIVEDARGQTPAGAALVYSGGPLVTPARDAIVALFDSLGPRVGSFGYGDWVGSLLVNRLAREVQALPGVYDHALVAPVASVEPTAETYPADSQVYLLVAGNILVRYA